mmetsp:Transcript_1975/g.3709  ORF Transcript_1975/g.3709 Transcript_1975/m.3709 type:complete len:170 (+) Transcript_1975:33-542(+)
MNILWVIALIFQIGNPMTINNLSQRGFGDCMGYSMSVHEKITPSLSYDCAKIGQVNAFNCCVFYGSSQFKSHKYRCILIGTAPNFHYKYPTSSPHYGHIHHPHHSKETHHNLQRAHTHTENTHIHHHHEYQSDQSSRTYVLAILFSVYPNGFARFSLLRPFFRTLASNS